MLVVKARIAQGRIGYGARVFEIRDGVVLNLKPSDPLYPILAQTWGLTTEKVERKKVAVEPVGPKEG